MSAIKQTLIKQIEGMSDSDARQILRLTRKWNREKNGDRAFRELMKDPAIRMPKNLTREFKKIKPLRGKGIPASKLLIADRR